MSLVLFATAAAACIASVHDGDSIRLCNGERIRLANIEAPEIPGSPKCDRRRKGWCDYALAKKSRDALRSLLDSGPAAINRLGTDRYGRTLARVTVNGKDAGEFLIASKLARRWR